MKKILISTIIAMFLILFGCGKVTEPEVVNPGMTETTDLEKSNRSKTDGVKLEILKTCFEVYESNVMMNTWKLAPAVKLKITNISGQERKFAIDVMFYKIKEKEIMGTSFFYKSIPDQFSKTLKAVSSTGYHISIPDTKTLEGEIGVRITV